MIGFIGVLETLNQLLTAGIAITAFSLLLYALSFNLRDRVARSFAIISVCVVIVFVGEAIASVSPTDEWVENWLKFQWIGLVFMPAAYLHFSDALMATTGRPSRGRRRKLVRLTYLISAAFLLSLPYSKLVGPLVPDGVPVPYLERTDLTVGFAAFYAIGMVWSWVNFTRAFNRTTTGVSRRRMRYLLTGALAPALGSVPYLLFGPGFAADHQLLFWLAATLSNLLVSGLIVVMAYAVAFFGVPWPDRVVKRRLFKWVMRGPVTASTVLAMTTLSERLAARLGSNFSVGIPVIMVGTLLLMQYLITMLSPVWERWFFYGGDRDNLQLVQTLEERLLTNSDIKQFLEAVLTAVCDRFQVKNAFVVALEPKGQEMIVLVGNPEGVTVGELEGELLRVLDQDDKAGDDSQVQLYSWGEYWLVSLYGEIDDEEILLGLLAVEKNTATPDEEQMEALVSLRSRAALALEDRYRQQQVFASLETLAPDVDRIQQLRAASRYDGTGTLLNDKEPVAPVDLNKWVKDALSHYWGGPKLTESPLMRLAVVQRALKSNEGSAANALRGILRKGIEQIRPEGDRRFTGEWILYNILEMKFMEGRKVREIAMRLAMSEADLYRKQRVAVDAVANAIVEMELDAMQEVENGLSVDEVEVNANHSKEL